MYISAVLTLFALGFYHAAAASASELEAIEPLFLEFSIQEVLTNTSWIPVVEPWASQYVSAVRDGRYGDAVWARYHIAGDVHDGIVGGTTNMTVLQSIEEDALSYKLNDPEDYAKAQALYAQTSDHDGHKDIIQTLSHIYNQDISHLEARVRYSTSCSRNFIALRSDCVQLLRHMSTREVAIGDEQGVASWGTCRLREIRSARGRVQGTSETPDNVSKHLDTIDELLSLVREELRLQTARVELQVKAITDVATELRSFLDNLAARQREKAVSQFFHALKSGNKDDKKLQGILDQLDRARNELRLRISVAQVGLLGNLQDGFRVAFGVLEQTNTRVNKVLGINLALMDIVKNQALQQTGQTVDGTIAIDTADVLAIGTSAPDDTASMNSSNEARKTNAYGNVTLGQARIMTGNIGFGHDVRIITGDMGGEAARGFNDSFWK
ncbi:hypothetical protein Focb16_v004218 [Fusarium oxysporum f. sp. cubense]|uniref:Uncharacterized protein n=1 Tax=Fusarium oxysporum f. sp. cubense TaxID=61366 RepID=A0A559KRX1_FUSOC|nr:hypothetical protein Focb16_v004218 [Fusarium oxysporum f. sp. cubense]